MANLRPLRDFDVAEVVALNQRNVEALAPMDAARCRELAKLSDRFDVIDVDGALAGFVVTFGPGTSYDSSNYRWFTERYGNDFYYLDRIVLHPRFRRRGLASLVYDEIEKVAATFHRLALEVSLRPRNDVSLAFHERRGFIEVGQLADEDHLVSLMVKDVP